MRLWIAEKPDAGRQLAQALGGKPDGRNPIQCPNGNVVFWAIGHLLELCPPADYDERYKKWTLEDLPIIPGVMQRKVIPDKAAHTRQLVDLIKKANEIVIATDPGREGEAIAWTILDHAKWQGNALRLWTNALNPSALKAAIANLLDDRSKKPLYVSAKLRASIDWTDGISWSRYYGIRASDYGDPVISIGRVQTATLAILVDRDREHENFRPSSYYELSARFDLPVGQLKLIHAPAEEKRITSKADAEAKASAAAADTGTLNVKKQGKKYPPPPPFSLPELQITCTSRWDWSAKRTLDTLQILYEQGLVTYPRTDCGHLPDGLLPDLPDHVAALHTLRHLAHLVPATPTIHKSVFDTSKTDDHHGIITTTEQGNLAKQSPDGQKLHTLIAKRFIAALLPEAEGFTTTISTDLAGMRFQTTGTIYTVQGWRRVWAEDPEEKQSNEDDSTDPSKKDEPAERTLPPIQDGTVAQPNEVSVLDKVTRPPPRFTEGSLIKAMMSAGSKSEDKDIRAVMKDCGIGTKATRQDIIEKIKSRDYCRTQGKHLISTDRGRSLIDVLRSDGNRLTDIEATAHLETELRKIEVDPRNAGPLWANHTQTLRQELAKLIAGRNPPKIATNQAPAKQAPSRTSGQGKASFSNSRKGSKSPHGNRAVRKK